MSKKITITVAGKSGTGKSTVMQLIERALIAAGFEPSAVTADYLDDGQPPTTPYHMRLKSIANMQVRIVEKQLPRERGPEVLDIIFNGEKKRTVLKEMSFSMIAQIALGADMYREGYAYTMVYKVRNGPSGTVIPGQTIKLQPNMIFSCYDTSNA